VNIPAVDSHAIAKWRVAVILFLEVAPTLEEGS
jgi:hypothetical protein